MSNTANLMLPYLAVGQAQKHVAVNETLRKLDAVVRLSVVSATLSTEPSSPADGAVYIVPAGKTGANWSAFADGSLGYYRDGAWVEISPCEGWLAFVKDTDELFFYTGSAWSRFPAGKILTVSATDKLLGRSSSGAGAAEEIALTAAGRALIDDADAAAQRATLGLGTAATQNTGTSGANVPLLNGANTWGSAQVFPTATTVGLGTGISRFSINGGAGSSEGANYAGAHNGTVKWVVGSYSSIVGGSNDADLTLFYVSPGALGATMYYYDGTKRPLYHSGNMPGKAATLLPDSDNAYNIGSASFRFGTVFAAIGAINTSDAREKTSLRPLNDAEISAIRRVMSGVGVYQWLDSITAKGQGDARLHVGVTAQAVAEAFAAEGLDASRYGLFCSDALEEVVAVDDAAVEATADDAAIDAAVETRLVTPTVKRAVLDDKGQPVMRMGVRYDQLLAMALATLFS